MNNRLLFLMIFLFSLFPLGALQARSPLKWVLIKDSYNQRTKTPISLNRENRPLPALPSITLFSSGGTAGENDENVLDDDEQIGLFYKGENLLRRAEILFFGSLTIVSFLSWISFSVFNVLVYDEPFGVLKRHQYLALYLGSSVISLSVSISDLLIRLNKPLKKHNIKVFD